MSHISDHKLSAIKEDAVGLYKGQVMHARLKSLNHRFTYSVFNIFIDLDRLEEAHHQSKLFSVNRRALVSFHEKDHGDGRSESLAEYIRLLLKKQGLKTPPERIRLLCYPRVFGYVFNPISIYFCESKGQLVAMVYEVRNTFGGKHIYVKPIVESERSPAGLRQECDKLFHVSPFLGMKMRYFFRVSAPGETLSFRILEKDDEGPVLSATLHATYGKLRSASLAKMLIQIPFLTLKVIASIHLEALKLWIKGAQFHSNPHKSDNRKEVKTSS